jgi:hypothetical protein
MARRRRRVQRSKEDNSVAPRPDRTGTNTHTHTHTHTCRHIHTQTHTHTHIHTHTHARTHARTHTHTHPHTHIHTHTHTHTHTRTHAHTLWRDGKKVDTLQTCKRPFFFLLELTFRSSSRAHPRLWRRIQSQHHRFFRIPLVCPIALHRAPIRTAAAVLDRCRFAQRAKHPRAGLAPWSWLQSSQTQRPSNPPCRSRVLLCPFVFSKSVQTTALCQAV